MFTPFAFVAPSELLDLAFDLRERLDPLPQHSAAGLGDHVDPLGRPGGVVVPGRVDEPIALEGAQDPVQIAHVDSLRGHERLQLLEELVAVTRVVPEDEEHGGFGEALEPGANLPAARAETAAAARPAGELHAPSHAAPDKLQCKTHIAETLAVGRPERLGYSRPLMRSTRTLATQTCAICERTLLLGERTMRFAPEGDDF